MPIPKFSVNFSLTGYFLKQSEEFELLNIRGEEVKGFKIWLQTIIMNLIYCLQNIQMILFTEDKTCKRLKKSVLFFAEYVSTYVLND